MGEILLIGKTGQLGEAVMSRAPSFGFQIVGFGRDEMNVLDGCQVEERISQINPRIVINTSAYHVVPSCEEHPSKAMEMNFAAVRRLARLCEKKNIIFVTYSTDYVFDGEKGSPYEEIDQPRPLQVYGVSKLAGERAALRIHPRGSFVIRTCGVFGGKDGSRQKGGNFVLNILREIRGGESVSVSSEQIVSPTYANDLGDATLRLLKANASPGVYHLVNEGYCSWYEFAREVFNLTNTDRKLVPVDRRGLSGKIVRPKFSALKNVKAKRLGIELPPWQESLKLYLAFLNFSR